MRPSFCFTLVRIPSGWRSGDSPGFYASLLIRQGLSVKAVQARLGHTSASVTLDTYGHLWPDVLRTLGNFQGMHLLPCVHVGH